MDPRRVRELLEQVREGQLNVEEAVSSLQGLPFKDLGFATVDHHRALRQGVPEVVFGEGKTGEQIAQIAQEMMRAKTNVLVTRLDADKAALVTKMVPEMRYSSIGRTGFVELSPPVKRPCAPVAVVTAGTSDMPVAEEAAETLYALGLEPRRMYDIGVAGIHRLLHRVDDLRSASAAIVCAGMEGALPSVVGGMISTPVVAVPTNVGYGTAMNGFTALFAMLTSCAAGVAVVNIENGFGAAMVVHRMMPHAVKASAESPQTAK
jgi:pyridinium-3,5-biscarboxylic acid mononucleotide synthase